MQAEDDMEMEDEAPEMEESESEEDSAAHEKKEKSGDELDASLVYEAAMKLLSQPEARQKVVTAVGGASDVGTAIGKMAGMLVSKIADELEARDLGVSDESLLGTSGAIARVLTAIYQTVNEEGMELPMQDTLIQAYEVAEADIESMIEQKSGMGQQPPMAPAGLMG